MRVLKILIGLILLIAIVLLVVGLTTPKQMHVAQTMEINAPVDQVFNQVNNLKNWENWSPWYKMEPTMNLTYSNNPSGANSWYKWKGEKTGEGQLTIMKTIPNQRIETALDFGDMGTSAGYWDFKNKGNSTEVTWGMNADAPGNPFARAMMRFFFPGQMKKSFNEGLTNMKEVVGG